MKLKEGIIHVDAAPASWGFTADRFAPDSYLWKTDDRIMVSFIEAKKKGQKHFSELVKAIEADGLKVAVPTPLGQMVKILTKWGFKPHLEDDAQIWSRP
jgi:hypothetical protein